jgi:hypothetical protein
MFEKFFVNAGYIGQSRLKERMVIMKMKLLSVLLVSALVLCLSGTSQAGSLSPTGWAEPIVIHASNYDQGTVYYDPDGNPDDPDDPDYNPLYPYAAPGVYNDPHNQLAYDQANGAIDDEDTWGIMRMDQILPGYVDEANWNIKPTGDPALWNLGDSGYELWAIFYGHTDEYVTINPDGSQNSLGSGMQFDVYAQPQGTFVSINEPLVNDQFGSGQRLAEDKYDGIGYEWVDDGDNIVEAGEIQAIAGSYLIISGYAQEGFFYDPANPTQVSDYDFASQFWPQGGPPGSAGDGEAQMWLSLYEEGNAEGHAVGTANDTFNQDWFHSQISDATADMRLQIDTFLVNDNTDVYDWLVTSSDPIQTYGVPEPVTMLGVFMGIGGLTNYMRKRKGLSLA